ncbi:hypothetical protein [Pseudanabaena sp. PCC 6802]|uniref:hypothetical protein n=1 Tax=Pseudanabaena sp. PCC 6802 TaxID=118173 RepID=UPI0003452DE7|nr:hypothetical protein [Pseudanabaena sp. PCC 6802]
MQSDFGKVTPLSQAKLNRQASNGMEIAEHRLREILSEVIDDRVTSKISRLEKSIVLISKQFDAILNGAAEDASLRITTDLDAADLALGGIQVPMEEYYIYTCSQLAEKLNVRLNDVVKMVKHLGLKGNPIYHREISIGVKSKVNKYSDKTLQKLREYAES